MISRRQYLKCMLAGSAFFGPWQFLRASTNAPPKPLRIGITVDLSGMHTDNGHAELRAIRMAMAEIDNTLLGRPLEAIVFDTKTDKDIATEAARILIEKENIAFMIGGINAPVVANLSAVAKKHGIIYFNTNSSSPSECGKNACRNKFTWDANSINFSRAIIQNTLRWVGRRWVLMSHNYSWAYESSAVIRREVGAGGGIILAELIVPVGCSDYADYLAQIRDLQPDVVATTVAGQNMQRLRSQIQAANMSESSTWISNQQNWPDIWLRGQQNLFGIFGTTWYHKLGLPGIDDFVRRYQYYYPDAPVPVPGNVFHNAYMATRALLNTVKILETTNNIEIIKALEKLKIPASERMQHHDAWINPKTHHLQQTVYMAAENPVPVDNTDFFSVLAFKDPIDVLDQESEKMAELESYEEIPVYDP